MIFKRGYWWPDSIRDKDVDFGINMIPYANAMLPYLKERKVLIQAGGCVGLYPIEQTSNFQNVFTFEPDPENFACLVKNLEFYGCAAFPRQQALWSENKVIGLNRRKYATHQVDETGAVEIIGITIDHFCDETGVTPNAFQLDVEGKEIEVLKGATETIWRCRPVIQVEELPSDDGQVEEFLLALGYKIVPKKFGKDRIYLP